MLILRDRLGLDDADRLPYSFRIANIVDLKLFLVLDIFAVFRVFDVAFDFDNDRVFHLVGNDNALEHFLFFGNCLWHKII